MAGAVGIDTEKVDRMTFGIGCGIAGIAGSAFTMIGSTGPTSGQLYIVDTFLVVVFGGAQSLLGTIASAFTISQTRSTLEFFTSGSMAQVVTLLGVVDHPDAAPAGPLRPQGPAVSASNTLENSPMPAPSRDESTLFDRKEWLALLLVVAWCSSWSSRCASTASASTWSANTSPTPMWRWASCCAGASAASSASARACSSASAAIASRCS